MTLRLAVSAVLAGALFAGASSTPVAAQSFDLGGKAYVSVAQYLNGAWMSETREPKQALRMDFTEGGLFVFENAAAGLVHRGVYEATRDKLVVMIKHSCERGKCTDIVPPSPVAYPLRLIEPNKLQSGTEDWERISNR
jgi:hypothetical protein